jgi:hypothetical protein
VSLDSEFELLSNWILRFRADYEASVLSDTETRGGPLMRDPASRTFGFEVQTDPRAALSFEPEVVVTRRSQDAGSRLELEWDTLWRPSPRWEVALCPVFVTRTDAAQFVASTGDPGYAPTFGERHLFATLTQTQISMQTRVEVALTPNLSLQGFAQPLISANDFDDYKQLRRPERFQFVRFREGTTTTGPSGVSCRDGRTCVRGGERFVDFQGNGQPDFSFSDQDFNLRSLVGQVVLRWEYMPGSTLFFVWREDRATRARAVNLNLGSDLRDLFRAGSQDRFIVKLQHFFDF